MDLAVISRLIWRTQQILQSQIKLLYRVEDVQFMALHNFVLKIKKVSLCWKTREPAQSRVWIFSCGVGLGQNSAGQAGRRKIFTGLLQDGSGQKSVVFFKIILRRKS